MKLSSTQVERAIQQIPAQALPDNHPSVAELNRVFGDHTFFLDESGLHIVEPAVPEEGGEAVCMVKLASWQDAGHTRLAAHQPEFSDVLIDLGTDGAGKPH